MKSGILEVKKANTEFTSIKVEGGGVLDVLVDMDVNDKVPGTDWGIVVDGTADPILKLKNGHTIKATNGVYIKQGAFVSNYNPNTTQTPKIDGAFRIDAGEIHLGAEPPQNIVAYTTLTVTGMTYLYGTGKFHTDIDVNNAGNRDAIHTEEKFDIGANFTVQPETDAASSFSPVLVSDKGFVDTTDPVNPNPAKWIIMRIGYNIEVKKV